MDAIGNIPLLLPQAVPAPSARGAQVPLPTMKPDVPDVSVDLQVAEQQRLQAIRDSVQTNIYVISDKTFAIFKDVTGQYITRFTSLRDGKVTYVPEPTLIRQSSPTPIMGSALNVKA